MKIKFLTFLGLVLLTGATAFGVQNCSKKDKDNNDPILGKWRMERLFAADNSEDLSCLNQGVQMAMEQLNKEIFIQYEFFSNGKVQLNSSLAEDILEYDWKKEKDNTYSIINPEIESVNVAKLINDKLQFHIPAEEDFKHKQQKQDIPEQVQQCIDKIQKVWADNQLNSEYKKI